MPKLFNSKADTLLYLKDKLFLSIVDDLLVFLVSDFKNDKSRVVSLIKKSFKRKVIIRSSCSNEDIEESTNAGHYVSISNVDLKDDTQIMKAIEEVASSYDLDPLHQQIFVQEQIDAEISGVVLTYDVSKNAPYYVISYTENDETSAVTSGKASKTLHVYEKYDRNNLLPRWKNLLDSIIEVTNVCDFRFLDIEFGFDLKGNIHIFQVRKIANSKNISYHDISRSMDDNIKAYQEKNYLLSNMAFWNPAEMIGALPHPLDYSLYEKLITNRAWNDGISAIGYSVITDPLMMKIGNGPYIKVDHAFSSLMLASFTDEIKNKLFNAYRDMFTKDKTKHDKIEFEIVASSFFFGLDKYLNNFAEYGFSKIEQAYLYQELKLFTEKLINDFGKIAENDKKTIEPVIVLTDKIFNEYENYSLKELLSAIDTLASNLIVNMVPQFARQARCGFISKSIIDSLQYTNLFSKKETEGFLMSIRTITSERRDDIIKYKQGKISREEITKKYEHLRPSTYDILSDNYSAESFIDSNFNLLVENKTEIHSLDLNKLSLCLKEYDFNVSVEDLVSFVVLSRQNREYFKFVYSNSVDVIIKMIERVAKLVSISEEKISFIPIDCITNYCFDSDEDYRNHLLEISEKNEQEYKENLSLILPDVITCVNDLTNVEFSEGRPNFVTEKQIEAETFFLDDSKDLEKKKDIIKGKIVLMVKAEPGNDWIFECGIVGLITMYGGAASHMAIRCAENDIPAAIGCGPQLFNAIKEEKRICINCKERKIERR